MRSPSKFSSLVFLENVRDNDYCTDKGIDYVPSEVDELIWGKQQRKDERDEEIYHREQKHHEFELLKSKGKKYCSKCREIK